MEDVIRIKKTQIVSAISLLAKYPDFYLRDLSKNVDLEKSHKLLSYAVNHLLRTEQYSIIIDAIKDHECPSILIPGTLGAYIFGCLLPDYGDGNQQCSPLCIGSVPSGTMSSGKCGEQVWVIRRLHGDVYFTKVNHSRSNTGIIYVDDEFSGFQSQDIQRFINAKLKTATVMTTTDNGHYTVIPRTSIHKLPMITNKSSTTTSTDDTSTTVVMVLSVILVLVILAFVVWAMLNY